MRTCTKQDYLQGYYQYLHHRVVVWIKYATSFYFFHYYLKYLFIYFWLCWVFVPALRLSLVAVSGGYSSLRCMGFSLQWPLLLQSTGSRCAGFSSCGSRAVEHQLSSCGTRAQLLCGMWDHPGPGLEPVSSALAGGFLTTAPPGKSTLLVFKSLEKCIVQGELSNTIS